MRFGIDFGTTRTVIAAVDHGRFPVAVFDTPRGYLDYLPGLAIAHQDRVDFGWDSLPESQGALTLRSIKRVAGRLAPDDPVPGWNGRDAALDLVTNYLRFVRRMLLNSSNLVIDPDEPLEAMVAVPANAGTGHRYLTVEAFSRAGFTVIGLMNEPTAAAVEFAFTNLAETTRSPKRYVVVYDLGGGTFDTSAVSLTGRRFEMLKSEGIASLGGDDFDSIILDAALERSGRSKDDISPSMLVRLLEMCREAKEGLTPNSRRLLIDLARVTPQMATTVLDVSEIYARCQPLVQRTVALLDRVFSNLAGYGIDVNNPRELGAVYLVGGSVHFPLVARTLRRLYHRKIQIASQPQATTAVGLAIAADPEARIFVRESSTRHIGVWREADDGRSKVFDPIVTKDTLPTDGQPIIVERRYRPVHSVGHLRFVECSDLDVDGRPCGDLVPWLDLYFPYSPNLAGRTDLSRMPTERSEALKTEEIVETYAYNLDGTLTIDIENRSRGYHRRRTVPWKAGAD